MTQFRYPTPTASPFVDIEQYIPLLLTAVGAELDNVSVWPEGEELTGQGYAEDLQAWIAELRNNMSIPVGGVIPFAGATPPSGWLLCDGSAVSETTYAALFALLGYAYGIGDAGTFKLPDLRGRVVVGAGQGASLTNRTLAQQFGSEAHLLTSAEMPSHTHSQFPHTHSITDSGHGHTVNNPTHTHTVTDPGHGHSVTDPGHAHTIPGRQAATDGTGVPRLASNSTSTTPNNTSAVTTGVGVNNANTGVSINAAATAVSVNNAATGISLATAQPNIIATGGGGSHNNIQPSLVLNYIIRAE